MSIFSSIRDAIFGGPAAAAPADTPAAAPAATTPAASTAPASSTPSTKPAPSPSAAPAAAAAPAPIAAKAAMTTVDVAAVLDKLDETSSEDLDWRKSIVDLMKLLKLDSSLKSRKALAKELNYTGDMGDSAKMNVWLHRQVMNKLAENGGVVPADLKD